MTTENKPVDKIQIRTSQIDRELLEQAYREIEANKMKKDKKGA